MDVWYNMNKYNKYFYTYWHENTKRILFLKEAEKISYIRIIQNCVLYLVGYSNIYIFSTFKIIVKM